MEFETLRQFCLSLPGVTEEVQWEDHLLFKVGGKMFCITELDYTGQMAFKVPDDDFEELSETPGFIAAPHLARAKWVRLVEPATIKQHAIQQYIQTSYELVKAKLPKKLQRELSS